MSIMNELKCCWNDLTGFLSKFRPRSDDMIKEGSLVRIKSDFKIRDVMNIEYYLSFTDCLEEVHDVSIERYLRKWMQISLDHNEKIATAKVFWNSKYEMKENGYVNYSKVIIVPETEKEESLYKSCDFKGSVKIVEMNYNIVVDRKRLGYRIESYKMVDDEDKSYYNFEGPKYYYAVIVDGRKLWFDEKNVNKLN